MEKGGTPRSDTSVKGKKKKAKLRLNLENFRMICDELGFEEAEPDDDNYVMKWSDGTTPVEELLKLKKWQRVNHFTGMYEIARKDTLGRNLKRMYQKFPSDYSYFPKTYMLPSDYSELRAQFQANKKGKTTYIVKPDAASQGRGIFLTRNLDDIDPMGSIIVQEYIHKPLLIDNTKFDLRIYVLVTGCDPLRIYLYREGLARFATEKYTPPTSSNMERVYMHLTNYSINKNNTNFVAEGEQGSKRPITEVFELLRKLGYKTDVIWADIADLIIKTIIAIQPRLIHCYNTCFPKDGLGNACCELLGFDVLLEKKKDGSIKPWLLEVNHAPSLNIDTPTDRSTKFKLLCDVFKILRLRPHVTKKAEKEKARERLMTKSYSTESRQEEEAKRKKSKEQETIREAKRAIGTGFDRIYPSSTSSKYDKFQIPTTSVETIASQARREMVMKKQEEAERKEQLEKMLRQTRRPLLAQAFANAEEQKLREMTKIEQLKSILKDEARTEGAAERDEPFQESQSPVKMERPISPKTSVAVFRRRNSEKTHLPTLAYADPYKRQLETALSIRTISLTNTPHSK